MVQSIVNRRSCLFGDEVHILQRSRVSSFAIRQGIGVWSTVRVSRPDQNMICRDPWHQRTRTIPQHSRKADQVEAYDGQRFIA